MKKIAYFTIVALALFFMPRQASVTSAADCSWSSMPNGMLVCNTGQPGNSANNYFGQASAGNYNVPSGNFYLTGNLNQVSNSCLSTAIIAWRTQNASQVQVTVVNPDSGQEQLFSTNSSGQQTAPWIASGKNYLFLLWDTTGGQKSLLAQMWVSSYNQPCNQPAANNPYMPPVTQPQQPPTQNQPANVTISDNFFSPATLTIAAGTTVTWTNSGSMMHTVTADNGSFGSNTLQPGATFRQTFTTPGTYRYYCRFHGGPGGVGMSGTIAVTGNQNQSPPTNSNNPTYNNPQTNNNSGNTFYDPYNNNLLGSSNNNNSNTFYDPYGVVPCISYACPGNAIGFP